MNDEELLDEYFKVLEEYRASLMTEFLDLYKQTQEGLKELKAILTGNSTTPITNKGKGGKYTIKPVKGK